MSKLHAIEGDIVQITRIKSLIRDTDVITVKGVVLERKKGLLGEDLTVVLSLFPYSEMRVYKDEYQVVKDNEGKHSEYEIGDLVRLRGTENVLYVDQKFDNSVGKKQRWLYNVREVNPTTARKSRFVQSCLLERVN